MITIYGLDERWISLTVCFIPLVFWGMWPTTREFCGYPMPAFALVNVLSQFCTALFYCAALGFVVTPDSSTNVFEDIDGAFMHPRTEDGLAVDSEYKSAIRLDMAMKYLSVLAAGFLLGHGDHLGALAMQFISPGIVAALYGGLCLVLGTLLNVIQVGASTNPPMFALGLGLVLAALGCLAAGQSLLAKRKAKKARAASNEKMLMESLHGVETFDDSDAQSKKCGTVGAIAICFTAACCSAAWSPLSTFARASHVVDCCNHTGNHTQFAANTSLQEDGFLLALLLVTGEILSLPSVTFIGCRVTGTSCRESLAAITLKNSHGKISLKQIRKLGFGVLCGVLVNSGYQCYFLSSAHISPSVAFAIGACNPLLAILADTIRCKFRGASIAAVVVLVLAVVLYASALAALAQTQ